MRTIGQTPRGDGEKSFPWSHPLETRLRVGGFTPFLFAVRGGGFDIVRALLAAGANVNETGGEGTTALAIAIVNAHFELAAFLLDQGADPNVDMPGGPALHCGQAGDEREHGVAYRPLQRVPHRQQADELVGELQHPGRNGHAFLSVAVEQAIRARPPATRASFHARLQASIIPVFMP